jgi:hypothetical protein
MRARFLDAGVPSVDIQILAPADRPDDGALATPDESSSAAPVVTPGPNARTVRLIPEVMLNMQGLRFEEASQNCACTRRAKTDAGPRSVL